MTKMDLALRQLMGGAQQQILGVPRGVSINCSAGQFK